MTHFLDVIEMCTFGPATKIYHADTSFPQCHFDLITPGQGLLALYFPGRTVLGCWQMHCLGAFLLPPLPVCKEALRMNLVVMPPAHPWEEGCGQLSCSHRVCATSPLPVRAILSPPALGENASLIYAIYFYTCIIYCVWISTQTQTTSQ